MGEIIIEKRDKKIKPTNLDEPLALLTLLLVAIGLVMLYSAGYAAAYDKKAMNYDPYFYVKKQAMYAAAGILVAYAASRFDYHKLRFWMPLICTGTMILMILVPFIGTKVKGARRWLFGIQPSELAKFALILFFAVTMTSVGRKEMKKFGRGFVYYLVALGAVVATLVLQKHLSAIVIMGMTAGIMMFVGGTRFIYLMVLVGTGIAGALTYIAVFPYAKARIDVWLDPFSQFKTAGWQASQSWIAIGSGGLWGLGLGQSRQKHLFLPEPANDFIFSVVCEELGFIGAMLVLIIFAAFIIRGYYIAMRARDKFGSLLAVGITTQIAIQVIFNICVVSGITPVTGVSLPFFSFGGSSLLMLLGEVGVLLSVSRYLKESTEDEE